MDNETVLFFQRRIKEIEKVKNEAWFTIDLSSGKVKKFLERNDGLGPWGYFDYSPDQGFLFDQNKRKFWIPIGSTEPQEIEFSEPLEQLMWHGEHILAQEVGFTGLLYLVSTTGEIKNVYNTGEHVLDAWINSSTLITVSQDSIQCWAIPSMLPLWALASNLADDLKGIHFYSSISTVVAVNPESIDQGFVGEVYVGSPSQIVRYNALTRESTVIWQQYGCFMLDSRMRISDDGKYLAITLAELQYDQKKQRGILIINLETSQETTYFP